MDPAIHVVTDSSCDLPSRVVEQLEIKVVPLVVRFGPDQYQDGALSAEEFWAKAAGPYHPQTSQPSVGSFERLFEQLVSAGRQVLCLTVTSKHSGTFNAARLAAERFGRAVEVFDSLSLSLGLGLQAMAAARAAQAGHSMRDIIGILTGMQARMHLMIVLDTLENLRRGGRADGFIAAVDRMTRAFNIKAVLNLVDGQLRLLGAARSFEGGLRRVMNLIERLGSLEHLAVVHTRRGALAEQVAETLAQRLGFPRAEVWVEETGAALATHAGPGTIGMLAVTAR